MSILVIAEQEEGLPNRPTLATIAAAKEIGSDIDLLVLDPLNNEDKISKVIGIRSILSFDKKIKALSEQTIELLQLVHKQKPYIFDLL